MFFTLRMRFELFSLEQLAKAINENSFPKRNVNSRIILVYNVG
ncbi:hypothetical protein [Fusobacterium nucleatum]|nr:hypothetical protein [Fusobacterium nucleatum]